MNASVEVSQLAHAVGQNIVFILRGSEYACIRPELLASAANVSFAHHLHGVERLAFLVFLLINFAIAKHLRQHMCRECIDAAHTYAMQTSAHLVRPLVKLTASVEHGHDHLQRAYALLLMNIYRYAASVILHGNRIVSIDSDLNVCTISRQSLVD